MMFVFLIYAKCHKHLFKASFFADLDADAFKIFLELGLYSHDIFLFLFFFKTLLKDQQFEHFCNLCH